MVRACNLDSFAVHGKRPEPVAAVAFLGRRRRFHLEVMIRKKIRRPRSPETALVDVARRLVRRVVDGKLRRRVVVPVVVSRRLFLRRFTVKSGPDPLEEDLARSVPWTSRIAAAAGAPGR